MKGREDMNIFKTKGDILGCRYKELSESHMLSFLCFTRKVRRQLGGKGYLLDYYLSLFFDTVNASLAADAVDKGFQHTGNYQAYCIDALKGADSKKESPLYAKTQEALRKHPEFLTFQEPITRMNLLYMTMADVFLADALALFTREREYAIASIADIIQMDELYEQISHIIGEPAMESLNLHLKQNFLAAPLVPVFMQGFCNDLICRLVSRDIETSRQIFQLLPDFMPSDEEV